MGKPMDLQKTKKENEAMVLMYGGEIFDWLPIYEITELRNKSDIINRALIMNAMIYIAFNAPVDVVKEYIKSNSLESHLSIVEKEILECTQETLHEQDKINMRWYLESLWAIIWVMNKFDNLNLTEHIPDNMIEYCPIISKGEGPEKFTKNTNIRTFDDIYKMRDFYYRAMWSCRNALLNNKPHENFNMSLIMERRRALTWCLDRSSDWDNIEQDT